MKYKIIFIVVFLILVFSSSYVTKQPPKSISKEFKVQESLVNQFILYGGDLSRLKFGLKNCTYLPYFSLLLKGGKITNFLDNVEQSEVEGFVYRNDLLNEKAIISYKKCYKYDFFYKRGFLVNLFLSKGKDDHIKEFKEERLCLKNETDTASINTVSFLLKSGMVLQVADISETKFFKDNTNKSPNYKIVRMYFVGNKINKSDFPKADIKEEF